MTIETTKTTQVTLANAAELAVSVILQVIGNDISDSINGTPIGASMLNGLAQARFQKNLNLN